MSVFCTTATPSPICHWSPLCHFERSLPSKRTMASDGGCESVLPGVTTFGSAHSMPLLYSFCPPPAQALTDHATTPPTATTPTTAHKTTRFPDIAFAPLLMKTWAFRIVEPRVGEGNEKSLAA